MCKPEEKTTQPNLIKVEEVSKNGLRLWSARFVYDCAFKDHGRLETALQRIKARASSLLGWTITLMSVLVGYSIQNEHRLYMLSVLMIMLVMFFISALFCYPVLIATPWGYFSISPSEIEEMQKKYKSESEIIEHLNLRLGKINVENAEELDKTRAKIRWA